MADKVDPADALLSTTKSATTTAKVTPEGKSPTPSGDPADALLSQTKSGAPAPESTDEGFLGNIAKNWKGELYQAGQGALEAGAGIAGIPTMLANAGAYLGGTPTHEMFGPGWNLQKLAQAGLYNPAPEAQPTDLTGRVARTLGGAVPTALASAIPGSPLSLSLGQNLLYSTVPGITGTLANYYTGLPESVTALLTAMGMTGVGGALGRSAARKAAEEAAAKAAADQAAHEAAGHDFRLGLKQETRTGRAEAERQKGFTEADAQKYHDSEQTGADADREAVAASLGQSHTMQEAGSNLQDAARTWKKDEFPVKLKDAENRMYYNPDGSVAIPEDAHGDLSNTMDSLKNSFLKAGELEPAAQQLRSRLPERFQSALESIAKGQGKDVPEATLMDMKKLRSVLGDAMTSPKLTEGVNPAKLNELYRALSSDMEGAIGNAAGPAGVARFKQFNEEAKRLYHLASGPVSDLISTVDKGGETITPTQAVKNMGLTDGTKLAQLSSEPTLKKGLDEVAAANLRKGTNLGDPGDSEKEFVGMPREVKTALYGDPNTYKIQNVIERRAQADKDLEDMRAAAAKVATQSKAGVAASKDVKMAERGKVGTQLKQEAERTAAETKGMDDPTRGILEYLKNMGWHTLGGGTGLLAAHELMPRLAEQTPGLPHWVGTLGYPALGLTGAAVAAGGRQMLRQPETIRNMLTGTLPTAPFTPSKLGWSLEEKKGP